MLTRHIAGRVYNYEYCIGKVAPVGKSFYQPCDFVPGSDGSLYVLNRGGEHLINWGLTKCTLDHDLIWENRGPGFANGQCTWPSSIDVDSDESVYVSDEYTSLISIFEKDGDHLGGWGEKGSGEGELDGPSGLAFDREDDLYIVDSLNHRVQKFTRDGKYLATWGSKGSGEGQFDMPWGIAIDGQGYVYVADWNNDRVQKFSSEGVYLASFGTPGTGEGQLRRPSGVAVDSEGDVYVTDWGNNRLNIYTPGGSFLTSLIGDAETPSVWCQGDIDANPDVVKARQRTDLTAEWRLERPVAVNVDDQGRIMVLETIRGRIQIYVKERNFVDAQFNL